LRIGKIADILPTRLGGTRQDRPSHLVGLIRPVGMRHSADAEDERSEGDVSEA
jgi:hypothetical protein